MLEQEAKAKEKSSSSPMPTLSEKLDDDNLPPEVALAIMYQMARRLEKEALAQVLTGHTPKGGTVTYIRMEKIIIDPEKGFVLAVPTEEKKNANGS